MEPFLAEIRAFPFTFAPSGWALCNGQLLPISQNTALFSLLGVTYGGDGKSTFGLPNLQGAAPLMPGQGNGLSAYDLGQSGGSENVTLLPTEMPIHIHFQMADTLDPADLNAPNPSRTLAQSQGVFAYQPSTANLVQMAPQALTPAGGSLPHSNMMPSLVMNFCIALQGVFPQRP
ncbi:phage tail protein [Deinococcus humi]|uniref:Microcystin-dependent protein n=1 Tax=Deinococcus humi TaxID=662880 RepID=A0A7W8NGA4_9DEIO|nr:tail fiber protein [Deinococcus humi]MBB5364605.1 microcystin-dependent protein [Deinococcus humi]GGO39218.1 tail Collar domain-containing protein [Deinococcus humi]